MTRSNTSLRRRGWQQSWELSALLAVGFICNLLIKPVEDKHYMSDGELEQHRARSPRKRMTSADALTAARGEFGVGGVLAWLAVGVPFLIGVWIALEKAAGLFH